MNKNIKKNKRENYVGTITAGLVGVTAAALGAYYLYGHKDAKKNRAKVKSWMLKAKGEIMEKLEDSEDITKSLYENTVDSVLKKYNKIKNIDPKDVEHFMKDLKDNWLHLTKTNKKISKKVSNKKTTKKKVSKKKNK